MFNFKNSYFCNFNFHKHIPPIILNFEGQIIGITNLFYLPVLGSVGHFGSSGICTTVVQSLFASAVTP